MGKDTFGFHRRVKEVRLFHSKQGKLIVTHQAYLTVSKGRKQSFMRALVPCRSRLYKLIVAFYFKGSFARDTWVSITKEDLTIIQSIMRFRKKYYVFKKCMEIKDEKGTEEARLFWEEKGKLFQLLNVMKKGH